MKPPLQIPFVFLCQGFPVIFRVAHHENLPPVPGGNQVNTRVGRLGQDLELGMLEHILPADPGMAGMRRIEVLVESAHQRMQRSGGPVAENTRELSSSGYLGIP